MTDLPQAEDATLFPKTAGEQLREAREAQGLSLAEVAARTRVPVRQLEAIELGNYTVLPSITYSVGFAKAYARAVGVDEVAVAAEVRANTASIAAPRRTEYETFTVDEPTARTPTRGLAIGGLVAALLILLAGGLWFGTNLFRDGGETPAPTFTPPAQVTDAPVATPTAVAPASGPVVLTATDDVWLRVYDAANKTLYLGTLKPGETYQVPAGATGPMINVGRPDKLQVTVGGTAIAPLGDGHVAIKDVPVSAAALLDRGAPPGGAAPAHDRAAASPAADSLNIAAPATASPEPTPSAAATPAP